MSLLYILKKLFQEFYMGKHLYGETLLLIYLLLCLKGTEYLKSDFDIM